MMKETMRAGITRRQRAHKKKLVENYGRSDRQYNCRDNTNLRYRQMGFSRGFGLGEQVGWKEGYQLGLQRGAQLATELGFYQGFVHAWITILEHEDPSKPR